MTHSDDERSLEDTQPTSQRPETDLPPAKHGPARLIRWSLPPRFRWPAVTLIVAAVVVAVLATTLPWQGGPNGPDSAAASPSPLGGAESVAPDATLGPSSTDRPPILAYAPLAELTAGSLVGGVVAVDSDFRLASVDGTPAADLASRLSVEPALEFAVEPEPDGTAVRLRPAAPLRPGVVYRFTLAATDGQPLDTWAFQAKQSVQVVATVPGDTSTDVPLDTGIEITFDQDGVLDPASNVVIRPATKGRFEQHGRTLAFVPAARLKPATVYTITIRRGVKVKGTDETLAEDFRFRFETSATAGARQSTFAFPDDLLEVRTAGRPDLPIWAFNEDGSDPKTARIEVFRFGGVVPAIDAFRQLHGSARWAQWSTDDAVPTTGLRRVMAFEASLRRGGDSLWFRLPANLAPGWYLVQRPSPRKPTQAILQVTDVAGYLTVSDSRTLVWANDLASGRALPGARITVEGSELGRTDDVGLLLAGTPARLLATASGAGATAAPDPIVIVTAADGRSMFMPAASQGIDGEFYGSNERAENYWLVYNTDRRVYRRTDTINVWGVIRDRATGAVPENVDVQLVTSASDPLPPPISTLRTQPGPTGAFTGSLSLRDLPYGSYDLVLRVGDAVVGSTGVQIDRILKPAYRIEVETGRRVYIQGDRIKITSRASFYEGSPVPGVPLRIEGNLERNVRTDATGTAVYRTTARIGRYSDESGFDYQSLQVSPARAEEGDIGGASREFIVFPSSRTIDADATIRGGRVRLQGTVHLVDRDRLEAEMAIGASPWDLDPNGKPVGGTVVSMTFIEHIPSRIKVGTQYDWIEKKVVPIYEYRVYENELRTIKARTAADGSFSTSVRDSGRKHDYSVKVSVGDPDGHTARTTAWAAGGYVTNDNLAENASLEATSPAVEHPDGYAIDDTIDLTLRETRPVSTGRYLFHFAQRGLREATVQSSPRLQTKFRSWAMPNVVISGVHFTGSRYVESDQYYAAFRSSDRVVQVALTTTRPRYAPGEEVTLDVRTRDRAGKPVAAAVIVQAVDAKLYAIGLAQETDPLGELYASISSGIRTSFASHRAQRPHPGEGGDTGGGGDDGSGGRSDFRDSLLFNVIQTGDDGRGRTTFGLSDDLTSWRVSAAAITADMGAGSDSIDVPVGLPFFVDASIAPEYLAGDRPSIQVRAYGSGLAAGADVQITVASDSLGLASQTVRAKAFATVTVPLPRLTTGVHSVTISARTGTAGSARQDRLIRSFTVIDSRLARTRTAYIDAFDSDPIPGGAALTTLAISDTSAGRYLPLLLQVSGGEGARLERALAAAMASSVLARRYGATEGVRPPGDFDGDRYQTLDGGIAPVPYASSDLHLSALVAIVAPERFGAGRLREYLESVLVNKKSTRERRVYAIAGLAGLGAPVLPQIQAAAVDRALTIREQLITGLGAAAIGDGATARAIAASLWNAHGEELAGVARLRVGDSASDITVATAQMAVLAAATGDARAPALWAYVEANPNTQAPYELFAVAFVDRLIDRLPVEPASFAYVVDDTRTVVELEPGETFQLTLTAAQRQRLSIEPLAGSIGVASTWQEPIAPSTIKRDPDITIRRSRTPAAVVRTSDLVRIDLTVRFGPKAPVGCHQVTDLVPSGLIPMGPMTSWYADEGDVSRGGVSSPFAVVGQRVMFCAEPTKKQRTLVLRYYARVITPGRYVWEPAIVESRTSPDRAAMTKEVAIRIR
jgi:alpha-2-macroglobulin